MTKSELIPFLFEFFEPRTTTTVSPLGTETFTKTANESGDADAIRNNRSFPRHAVLGTETVTHIRREDSDSDAPRRVDTALLGTETATATRETPDHDQPSRHQSVSLGTETFTRARENSDADASSEMGHVALWTARIL